MWKRRRQKKNDNENKRKRYSETTIYRKHLASGDVRHKQSWQLGTESPSIHQLWAQKMAPTCIVPCTSFTRHQESQSFWSIPTQLTPLNPNYKGKQKSKQICKLLTINELCFKTFSLSPKLWARPHLRGFVRIRILFDTFRPSVHTNTRIGSSEAV